MHGPIPCLPRRSPQTTCLPSGQFSTANRLVDVARLLFSTGIVELKMSRPRHVVAERPSLQQIAISARTG